ncbi:hypothetical protein [Eleftheria terrae]|nr:hypothetical protein [Eleftheria terrae]WKB56192.1 hypothetical protein N7L95_29570 [Eleftheria terrae]
MKADRDAIRSTHPCGKQFQSGKPVDGVPKDIHKLSREQVREHQDAAAHA